MSYPICRDLQQQTRFFDGVLCRAEIQVNLTAGGDPKPVAAEIVSGSYFPVLGIGPALGRVIEEPMTPLPAPVRSSFSRTISGRPSLAGQRTS